MTNVKQAKIGLPLNVVMREEVVSKILNVPLNTRLEAVIAERSRVDEERDNAKETTKKPA